MRYCAETRRLLKALRAIHTQNTLGRGRAFELYVAQARQSAARIIAKGC